MKVIKVGAIWCAGCLVMKPIWKDIENEIPELETEYYDFDNNSKEIEKYNIDGNLPCFIFLDKNGQEIERLHGEYNKKKLLKKIEEYINL